jgi:hypothetical protein
MLQVNIRLTIVDRGIRLTMRECPIRTARRFPKALRAIKKLRPFDAPLLPNTAAKNKLAAFCLAAMRSALGTAAK